MESISVLQRPVRTIDKRVRTTVNRTNVSNETRKNQLVPDQLNAEVDENFKNYLNSHGLSNEDNLLVLSSKLHYYYDYEELHDVTTLINLKKLNLIKHLDEFLQTLYNGLSPKTNFIGCFSDNKSRESVSLISKLYRKFINFLDAKIDLDMNSKNFSRLLESHGFKVIDMTVINGLTYFRTQNHR
jgi:hypothetical protein